MDYYPSNTVARYITKLPQVTELDGDWEVALTEISVPAKLPDVTRDTHFFTLTSADSDETCKARYETINILASLFQIADLNLSLTFSQTCLLSLRCYHQLVINVDVLIEAGLEYKPGLEYRPVV